MYLQLVIVFFLRMSFTVFTNFSLSLFANQSQLVKQTCTAPRIAATATMHACATDRCVFASIMLCMFACVTGYTEPYFRCARFPVPTNLNLGEWAAICATEEDALTLEYLTFGFPAGYEGPVSNPTFP